MEIQYYGHSCFRLKSREGSVITDPYGSMVGWKSPAMKAEVVTVSHQHEDHNNFLAVKPNGNRRKPFIIEQAGEYEVGGITVFGYPTWHDENQGADRGQNLVFSIFLEDLHILHLGDLGHPLSEKIVEEAGNVDVLLCPVGGEYTIGPQAATEVIRAVAPEIVIPMHYKTPAHDQKVFGELATLEDFMSKYGKTAEPQDRLVLTSRSGDEESETQLIVLEPKIN